MEASVTIFAQALSAPGGEAPSAFLVDLAAHGPRVGGGTWRNSGRLTGRGVDRAIGGAEPPWLTCQDCSDCPPCSNQCSCGAEALIPVGLALSFGVLLGFALGVVVGM